MLVESLWTLNTACKSEHESCVLLVSGTASQAVQGFTAAINDGSFQAQMLSLSGLTVSSAAYTQQPTITTPSNTSSLVVNAPAAATQKSVPGTHVVVKALHSNSCAYALKSV